MSEISNITPATSVRIQAASTSPGSASGEITQSTTVVDVKTVDENALKQDSNQKLSLDAMKEAVKAGNTMLQSASSSLSFEIDSATKQVVVKIVDRNTGELVRQIPTVEMLDFMRRMKELEGNSGSLIQAKA
ncbi:MAG: flagellar protein FlaG [Methylococcales bacterium]|jgi:flagellar protein FlaG|nr:flagellar protein FlaG [Methylococcales bacterium]